MNSQSTAGRRRVGEHIIELREPRLSDADSWRRTHLDHEKRLRPIFGSPHTDWDAEHSTAAWATQWWRFRTDPEVLSARVVIVDDGTGERLVGQQIFAGRDPRTGHTEATTWMAGLSNSRAASVYVSAVNMLEIFLANPELPCIIAPLSVTNKAVTALAKDVGFLYVQTQRALREVEGVPLDHVIMHVPNTPERREYLAGLIASTATDHLPSSAARRPSRAALRGAARVVARKVRHRSPSGIAAPIPLPPTTDVDGHTVEFRSRAADLYDTTVDGHDLDRIQVHRDQGTSTTEVIEWLAADAATAEADAAIVAACHAITAAQNTRRVTIALADRNSGAAEALSARGFISEGTTLPTLGDEATRREGWTHIAGQ